MLMPLHTNLLRVEAKCLVTASQKGCFTWTSCPVAQLDESQEINQCKLLLTMGTVQMLRMQTGFTRGCLFMTCDKHE